MGKFVTVYSKTTGRKQDVPAAWLDHPVLGRDFRKTPLSEKQAADAAKRMAAAPVEQPTGDSPVINETPAEGDKE